MRDVSDQKKRVYHGPLTESANYTSSVNRQTNDRQTVYIASYAHIFAYNIWLIAQTIPTLTSTAAATAVAAAAATS